MKKINLFILLIVLLIMFFGCTVNETTGVIRVKNATALPLRNVRVGNTFIVGYVAGGASYDYWYFTDIEGKLTTEGISVSEAEKDNEYILKPGFWVFITAANNNTDGDEEVTLRAQAQGTGTADFRKD